MEQLNFNMLFRWFAGAWAGRWRVGRSARSATTGTVFWSAEVSEAAELAGVIQQAQPVRGLLSRDHFSVDGTFDRGLDTSMNELFVPKVLRTIWRRARSWVCNADTGKVHGEKLCSNRDAMQASALDP